jgi:hypothetical protein
MGGSGETVSYAQLEDRSIRLAQALASYKRLLRERYWQGHDSLVS